MSKADHINFSTTILWRNLPTNSTLNFTCSPSEDELEDLINRAQLLDIRDVSSHVELSIQKEEIELKGALRAVVTQECVATMKPVDATLDIPLHIKIYPPYVKETPFDEFLELEYDEEYLDSDEIHIGELLTQYIALSLNPYPRHKDAPEPKGDEKNLEPENENTLKHQLKKLLN